MGDRIGSEFVRPGGPLGKLLDYACRGFAMGGGLVLVSMALMSVVSVIGRATLGKPVLGDFELVQLGCAISVSMFLPYCQMIRGHVIVDFFTAGLDRRARAFLDALAAIVLAAVAFLIAWRLSVGLVEIRGTGDSSMLLRIPTWYAFVPMVPSFFLLGAAALYTTFVNVQQVRG
ncbi:MAG TPA: TRAP transporter small permease [Rhodocyclaceae bacterium]|jgi:TRAP-type C4-dicarboxylate transport system permease small subunit|nr:TRAP transporter small permease [Rhodocyclaceae bacterium]HRQ46890.1 TRAP transporter small permease [Rhodocyclaceae bacterium]